LGPPADKGALRRAGKDGVLAVVGDSTNVFSRGHAGSESEVRASLIGLLARYDGLIAVSCFATNAARLESIAIAAQANDRHAALVGRSLWRIDKAARENGYLSDLPPFLTDHDAAYLPNDKVVYICTGSQGEPRAALARIAAGDHPHVTLGKGDVAIFSSRIIPGNEKEIFRLQNDLVRLGVEVVTEKDEFVHVSGHPGREEMEELYHLLRPRVAVPVHGEARHLQEHARLARACGVAETVEISDGAMLRLAPGPVEVVEHVPTGRLCVDGPRLVRLDSEILRNRRRMVFNGSAVVTVVLDKATRTRELVEASGEFALQLPTLPMAAMTVAIGTDSAKTHPDKLQQHGVELFHAPGHADTPLVQGCAAWLLCRVIPEPHNQQTYDLFIGEVVAAWADERVFRNGHWEFDTAPDALRTLHYVAGGQFYATGASVRV